eukprot:3382459-Heterocapsa_arctica.AAC.1
MAAPTKCLCGGGPSWRRLDPLRASRTAKVAGSVRNGRSHEGPDRFKIAALTFGRIGSKWSLPRRAFVEVTLRGGG